MLLCKKKKNQLLVRVKSGSRYNNVSSNFSDLTSWIPMMMPNDSIDAMSVPTLAHVSVAMWLSIMSVWAEMI